MLVVDIVLVNEGPYKCQITTRDLSPTSAAAAAAAGDDNDFDNDNNDDDVNDDVDDEFCTADVNGFGV